MTDDPDLRRLRSGLLHAMALGLVMWAAVAVLVLKVAYA